MQVYPVAGNINGHAELKPEGVRWIEDAEIHEKAHSAHSISQLVQYSPKLGALIEVSRCMAVHRVQQSTEYIAPRGYNVVRWHVVEGYQCQKHPCKT